MSKKGQSSGSGSGSGSRGRTGAAYRPAIPPPNANNRGSHWYPQANEISSHASLQNTLRVVLDQFYALQDQHDMLMQSHAALEGQVREQSASAREGPPPGSGPTDTQICGLRVTPIDTNSLANGASLKYNKSLGQFEFS